MLNFLPTLNKDYLYFSQLCLDRRFWNSKKKKKPTHNKLTGNCISSMDKCFALITRHLADMEHLQISAGFWENILEVCLFPWETLQYCLCISSEIICVLIMFCLLNIRAQNHYESIPFLIFLSKQNFLIYFETDMAKHATVLIPNGYSQIQRSKSG